MNMFCIYKGAGIGITGILLYHSYNDNVDKHNNSHVNHINYIEYMQNNEIAKIILTDFHPDVIMNLKHNIYINEELCDKLSSNYHNTINYNNDTIITSTTNNINTNDYNDVNNNNNISINNHKDNCKLEAKLLDWVTVTMNDFLLYQAKIMLIADCTYSIDGNIELIKSIRYFLLTMSSNYTNNQNNRNTNNYNTITTTTNYNQQSYYNEKYLEYLMNNNEPYVLIACTVRDMNTYLHFIESIQNDKQLIYRDLTYWGINIAIPNSIPFYYYTEDIHNIKLFCIHLVS